MMLITKEIASKLKKADDAFVASEDGETTDEISLKLFAPWGAATWYIVRGTPLDSINGEPVDDPADAKDWHLFGFANLGDPMCAELGYVLLSELESVNGPFGLKIERDRNYTGSLKEVMAKTYGERGAA
jgi:hypothetical protein